MTKLSDFLSDMRDSDKKVLVTEKQLRQFAQNNEQLGRLLDTAQRRIKSLEAKISVMGVYEPDTIDLFA